MCHLVVGVHLYTQVALGVDKLYQQGELIAESLVILLAHKFVFQFTN
jgi:hypothetical protein